MRAWLRKLLPLGSGAPLTSVCAIGPQPAAAAGKAAAVLGAATPDATKPETKHPGGRPALGDKPMTSAERSRRHRAAKRAANVEYRPGQLDALWPPAAAPSGLKSLLPGGRPFFYKIGGSFIRLVAVDQPQLRWLLAVVFDPTRPMLALAPHRHEQTHLTTFGVLRHDLPAEDVKRMDEAPK